MLESKFESLVYIYHYLTKYYVYLKLKISCDLSKFRTLARISASFWGSSFSSSFKDRPVTYVNSDWAVWQFLIPFLLKKFVMLTQSLYKNSNPCGWLGSTDWLTSINQHWLSCHRILYSLKRMRDILNIWILMFSIILRLFYQAINAHLKSACTKWHRLYRVFIISIVSS